MDPSTHDPPDVRRAVSITRAALDHGLRLARCHREDAGGVHLLLSDDPGRWLEVDVDARGGAVARLRGGEYEDADQLHIPPEAERERVRQMAVWLRTGRLLVA